MNIRKAENKDAAGVLHLLSQVLEIHAAIRPDIFISGTTKYTEKDLYDIFAAEDRRSYVAVDDSGTVLGYALCEIKQPPDSVNVVPFTTLYIDDLCVDSELRGRHIGKALFEYVKSEAKALGCYEVTLNVWEGNEPAQKFYESMGMKPMKTYMEFILDQ